MSARIYIEGGGPSKGKNTAAKCRQAFRLFFDKFLPPRRLHIVASGGREEAYRDFTNATANSLYGGGIIFLLVDSESHAATNRSARQYLNERDNWTFPADVSDDQLHMMVQCMESWFVADKLALSEYYGSGFLMNSLPANPNVELIEKRDIAAALRHASRNTSKGTYDKGIHSFAILQVISPDLVFQASFWARRLRDTLLSHVQSL